jgi:hypothetical protein
VGQPACAPLQRQSLLDTGGKSLFSQHVGALNPASHLGSAYAHALHAAELLHAAQHRLGSAEGRSKGEPC